MDDALSAERDVPAQPGRLDPLLPGLALPIGWRWSTARTSSGSREHRPPDVHQVASTGRLVSPSIPIPRLCVDFPRAGGRALLHLAGSLGPGRWRFCRSGRAGSFHCLAPVLPELAMSCWLVRSKRTMAGVSGLVLPACLLGLFAPSVRAGFLDASCPVVTGSRIAALRGVRRPCSGRSPVQPSSFQPGRTIWRAVVRLGRVVFARTLGLAGLDVCRGESTSFAGGTAGQRHRKGKCSLTEGQRRALCV